MTPTLFDRDRIPRDMREVSREEFYRAIGPQDVHARIDGPYPYTSVFMTPRHEMKGKAVDIGFGESRYFLP